jgi:UDP-N-acetylmuramoyl-tripeptide--D-alanyl-D-alanine ligase
MRKVVDLFRLLYGVPGGHKIFLRREYDRLSPMLRSMAGIYRRRVLTRTHVVAVVGSLGKTTATRTLETALDCPDRKISYSNYGASLAANLLSIRPGDRHAVLETGIAGPGLMARYAKMIRPDVVVVTSIKSDHNRSFPTLLDTREEKVKMVRALSERGLALLNGDDPNVRWMASQTRARIVTFGLGAENAVRATDIVAGAEQTEFTAHIEGATYRVRSPLSGEHMIYPMLAAVAAAHLEKIEMTGALSRLAALQPTTSRMNLVTLPNGIRILDDSCKGSIESVQAALEALAQMPAERKVIVLGNVEEPPGKQRDVYRDLGRRLGRAANVVICIGSDSMTSLRPAAVDAGMDRASIHFAGTKIPDAMALIQQTVRPGDLVLVKGASSQRFRRIVLGLMGKKISCEATHCNAKVLSCDLCPLLDAPEAFFKNHFINRYVEL